MKNLTLLFIGFSVGVVISSIVCIYLFINKMHFDSVNAIHIAVYNYEMAKQHSDYSEILLRLNSSIDCALSSYEISKNGVLDFGVFDAHSELLARASELRATPCNYPESK